MKIAILAPECSPSWGGVGSYTYNLACNLPRESEIHIITIDRRAKDSFEETLIGNDVNIHKIIPVSQDDSFFYNLKFQLALIRQIKRLDSSYGFDIIHSHSGHLPHYFSQFWDVAPMAVTVHTESKGIKNARRSIMYRRDRTEILNDLFSPIIELGEKITFKRAQRLMPISQFTLNQIIKIYGINVDCRAKVIHNGVDIDLFKSKAIEKNKHITIAFVGRLYAVKGLDVFLKSVSDIMKLGYKINVLLVGRGDTEYLKRALSQMPTDSYQIMGRVSYLEMVDIYNVSDMVVMPSLYEGCSGTILEAMSCEKIVIASNAGGTPEIIRDGHNGILVEPRNPAQLTTKILDLFEETIDLDKLRRNARKTVVEDFNWRDKGRDVYREYLKVCKDDH